MGMSPYGARLLPRAVVRPFLPLLLGILACRRAAPIATVPFDGPGHLVFVHVTAGQRDAGWWMLDSGFEYSVVSTRTADALGLARGAASGVPQPGGTVEESWTRAVALGFGGVPFRAESLAVKAVASGQNHRPPGAHPRELDRGFDGFSAAVRKDGDLEVSRCDRA